MAVSACGRRRRMPMIVAVIATFLAIAGSSTAAYADPGTDSEGSSQALAEKLEAAARGYYDAKAVLTASEQRQAEITQNLQVSQAGLARLTEQVGRVAAARYKGSSIGLLNGLITDRADPQELLAGAAVGEYLTWRDDTYIREYRTIKDEAERQQGLLTAELEIQSKQVAALDAQKREAEKALASVGGMVTAGYGGPAQPAQPAVRNSDGSFPRESCSIDDPTHTGGCVTPRMFHTLNEAHLAGFNHYVACWPGRDWGEHPPC